MTPERWRKIEELYHAAQEHAPRDRAAFLAGACNGDAELKSEIERLLARDSDGKILDSPASQVLAVSPGDKLGPYEIVSRIGAGGMGEVWKARDTRLDRIVAIKTSRTEFSVRFEREARAAAALNHPNICQLYDVGPNYLVMEYVEGETLAARLRRGELKLDQALALAIQITAALAEAHSKGVVHRDLKPANIMLSKSAIKILDFGLAKIARQFSDADHAATLTAEGTILGTVQYMSPEQAQGLQTDARSDIFSFGLVLYEMISGEQAFKGANPASIIALILERDAPVLEPEGLNRIVQVCLAKDPAARFQSALDLKRAIEWSAIGNDSKTPDNPRLRSRLAWGLAALFALSLISLANIHFREKPTTPAAPVRFEVKPPINSEGAPSLSPDGRKLAFADSNQLWVYSLESEEWHNLADAQKGAIFWSPDSRFIGYPYKGKLRKIEAIGGSPQTITELRSDMWGCGAWNKNDVIVFGDLPVGLFRVPASGGVPIQITARDPAQLKDKGHFCPSFLPDGRHFVYTRNSAEDGGKGYIYLASVDATPAQQSSVPLLSTNSQPIYAPTRDPDMGYLLFVRNGTLVAQPFDNRRLEPKGEAISVVEQLTGKISAANYIPFSLSGNNILAFKRSGKFDWVPTWYDREGEVMGTAGEPSAYGSMAISMDGTRLAVTKDFARERSRNIWLLDLLRSGTGTRLTFDSGIDASPVWSPDGRSIIFSSNRDGPFNLYQKLSSGTKEEEVLLKSNENKHASSWSRDGRLLLYTVDHAPTKSDVWVLPLAGSRKPVPFLNTEFNERAARFSPDGHWVAYVSDESGKEEVYVRSFAMNSAGTAVEAGGKWKVSDEWSGSPRWRGDGRELYYQARDGKTMAVEISFKESFHSGKPTPLGVSIRGNWDSSADGSRFLGLANKQGLEPYTVILNWQSGLRN